MEANMCRIKDLSYDDRLRRLKLPTLNYRRIRGNMIELYKIRRVSLPVTGRLYIAIPSRQSVVIGRSGHVMISDVNIVEDGSEFRCWQWRRPRRQDLRTDRATIRSQSSMVGPQTIWVNYYI